MSANQEGIEQLASMGFAPLVVRHHGAAGGQALRAIMTALRQIYRQFQPQSSSPRLVVFQLISKDSYEIDGISSKLYEWSDILSWVDEPLAIEVAADDAILVWPSLNQADLTELSRHGVVYSFQGGKEYFWAGGEQLGIPQIVPGAASLFAVPAFGLLEEALQFYRSTVVRVCQCEILKSAWYDVNRLFLKSKPEKLMRRSLVQFLRASLRHAAEVAPEQNVDESHPIDIRVTFEATQNVALIEIKWLGRSRNEEDGTEATPYSEQRARDGAKQLAEYLDMFHHSAPLRHTRGYLVAIDGRRRGLTLDATSISYQNGMYYNHREIPFNPNFHDIRNDFEEPLRMFAEPVCS